MKMRVSPAFSRNGSPAGLALQHARGGGADGDDPPPFGFARFSAAAAAASIVYASSCIACASSVSAVTGLNVPEPTCSVTNVLSTPRRSNSAR